MGGEGRRDTWKEGKKEDMGAKEGEGERHGEGKEEDTEKEERRKDIREKGGKYGNIERRDT